MQGAATQAMPGISSGSFDLGGWKTLSFSAVFHPGQEEAGSSRIDVDTTISSVATPQIGWEELPAYR